MASEILQGLLSSGVDPRQLEELRNLQTARARNPLLAEAGRTAGMFSRSLGRAIGTDMRSPAERKRAEVKAVLDAAEGETMQDKLLNSADVLKERGLLEPEQAAQLDTLRAQRQATQAQTSQRRAIADRLVKLGHEDLAMLAASSSNPLELLKEAERRNEKANERAGTQQLNQQREQIAQSLAERGYDDLARLAGMSNNLLALIKEADDRDAKKASATASEQESAEQREQRLMLAQGLAEEGFEDLAAALITKQIDAGKAFTEARLRRENQQGGQRTPSASETPTESDIDLFTDIADTNKLVSEQIDSLVKKKPSGLSRAIGALPGMDSPEDTASVNREQIIRIASARAKTLRENNPGLTNPRAFALAVLQLSREMEAGGQ